MGDTRSRGRRLAVGVARWGLALLALGFLVRYIVVNIDQLRDADLAFRLPWLAASLVALVVYMLGRALAWHDITVRNGVAIPLREAVLSWFTSLLGKYLPGKVFLLLGRLQAYDAHDRSRPKVTFAFFQETVTSLLSSVLTILLALVVGDIDQAEDFRAPLIGALVVLLVGMHPRILEPALNLALRIVRRPAVRLTLTYGDVLRFVTIQTLVWIVFGVAFYLFINAIYSVELAAILYLAAAISLASLIGILALFAPSGLGVREGLLALLMADVMPGPLAAVIALASRVWVTVGEALCIGVAAVLSARLARRRPSVSAPRAGDAS